MKVPHNNGHGEQDAENKGVIERLRKKVKNYWKSLYCSNNCKKMSRGSYDIMRSMSWAHGEEWRKNHPKSLHKKH